MKFTQLELNFDPDENKTKEEAENKKLQEERDKIGVELNIYGSARERMYKKDGIWMIGNESAVEYSKKMDELYENDEEHYKGQR